jgi:molybdate transport system substrate-binding protein
VKGHVANTEDMLAALAHVSRGEAVLGFVFGTDARLDQGVRVVGTFPAGSHSPIVCPVARVARSTNPDAEKVLAFLRSAAARPIFESFGYVVLAQ